ncbi:MAG: hypothetical protein ABFD25_11525 [Clostridiaceae bacterium]
MNIGWIRKTFCVIFSVIILTIGTSGVTNAEITGDASIVPGTEPEKPLGFDIVQQSAAYSVEPFKLVFGLNNIEGSLAEKTERYTSTAVKTSETYKIKSIGSTWGYVAFDTYSFLNGDLYYYLKYTPINSKAGEIRFILPYLPGPFDLRTVEYPKGLDYSTSVIKLHEKQSIEDNALNKNLSPGSVYIDSDSLFCFFSYASVYERKPNKIREELYDKAANISVTAKGIVVALPSGGTGSFTEQWGLISKEKLVDWKDKQSVDAIRIADMNRVRKWGGDGQYYMLPVGYSPYSAAGFYRNNANHIGNKFITGGCKGRLFEDYGFVTTDTLVRTQNDDGFWATSPLSDWLYKDYKIGAGFFDTRWDTEAALSLLRGYRKYGEPEALEAACKFADFYCDFTSEHSYKTANGGTLVYDYGFIPIPGIKTHVSLNHLLNEMNFLLEMYITTEDKTYADTAGKILKGVRDTSSSWRNPANGDLHYAYMGNGKYGLKDYPTLTLNDLKYSRSLIKKVFGVEDAAIAKLITIKEKYLTAHKIAY